MDWNWSSRRSSSAFPPRGDVTTRNQQIAHLFVKGEGPDSLEQKVVSVRFVGDVAIVNGTYVMSWKTEKGPVLEKGIFSHVFEHVRTTGFASTHSARWWPKIANGPRPRKSPNQSAAMPSCRCIFRLIYKGPDSTQPPPPPGTGQPPRKKMLGGQPRFIQCTARLGGPFKPYFGLSGWPTVVLVQAFMEAASRPRAV